MRRILGAKGVRIARNVVSSIYRALKIVPPPSNYREPGVSAIMWTKNEEDWIELSMRSIAPLVSEYVLVDASTDRTPEIAREVGKELGIPVKIVKCYSKNMAEVGNVGLKNVSYMWILKWDPDFVLHEAYVDYLRKLVDKLTEDNWYYAVYWPHICLDGDLFHYDPTNYLHIEHWLYTYHPKLKYIMIGWMEHLVLPAFYKRIDITKPLSFHLRTVKSPVRLLYRHYWYEARSRGLLDKIDLEVYVKSRIVDDYGTDDIAKAAEMYMQSLLNKLAKYDPSRHLSYPEIMRKYVKERFGIQLP